MGRPCVFISHSDQDREIADALANSLRRSTLHQVDVWFSSDRSPQGGISAGNSWITEILQRLRESSTVIAIVTPQSIAKPWLHFEAGYVAGRDGTLIVPVCLGIDITRVPPPIAIYQMYSLADRASFSALLAKIAGRFSIHFDDAMTRPVVDEALQRIAHARSKADAGEDSRELSTREVLDTIQGMLDRRFVELGSMFQTALTEPTARDAVAVADRKLANRETPMDYSVAVDIVFMDVKKTESLLISANTTVQDVLDTLYFALQRRVEPYKYMQRFVLLSPEGWPLLVRGFQSHVNAAAIFRPGSRWRLAELKKPYTAGQPLETVLGDVQEHVR